jgi:hypothetical protein
MKVKRCREFETRFVLVAMATANLLACSAQNGLTEDQNRRLKAVMDYSGKAHELTFSKAAEIIQRDKEMGVEGQLRDMELMNEIIKATITNRTVSVADKSDAISIMSIYGEFVEEDDSMDKTGFDKRPNPAFNMWRPVRLRILSDEEAQKVWDAYTNKTQIAALIINERRLKSAALASSDFFRDVTKLAVTNVCVINQLGEPVMVGTNVQGELSERTGTAGMTVPLSGPFGNGFLCARAKKKDGPWKLDPFELHYNGTNVIHLTWCIPTARTAKVEPPSRDASGVLRFDSGDALYAYLTDIMSQKDFEAGVRKDILNSARPAQLIQDVLSAAGCMRVLNTMHPLDARERRASFDYLLHNTNATIDLEEIYTHIRTPPK